MNETVYANIQSGWLRLPLALSRPSIRIECVCVCVLSAHAQSRGCPYSIDGRCSGPSQGTTPCSGTKAECHQNVGILAPRKCQGKADSCLQLCTDSGRAVVGYLSKQHRRIIAQAYSSGKDRSLCSCFPWCFWMQDESASSKCLFSLAASWQERLSGSQALSTADISTRGKVIPPMNPPFVVLKNHNGLCLLRNSSRPWKEVPVPGDVHSFLDRPKYWNNFDQGSPSLNICF